MKCVNLSVLSPGAGVRYAHMSTRRYGNKQEREARRGKKRPCRSRGGGYNYCPDMYDLVYRLLEQNLHLARTRRLAETSL